MPPAASRQPPATDKKLFFALVPALFLNVAWAVQAQAETWQLDLSRAANRGFTDEKADDGLGGWTDQGSEADFKEFPSGSRDFLGVPFHILPPASNDGKTAVILKGRFRPDFPETASASADGRKAAWLYFLHTCAWPGTDRNQVFARYEILYRDGTALNIPLRVGVETAGTWGPGTGDACRTAWTRKVAVSAVGIQLFGWRNPHPDKALERVTLRSLGKSTVPILLAVTGSTREIALSSLPEDAVPGEGSKWEPSADGAAGSLPMDVSMTLKNSPVGSWTIQQGRFSDAKGRRARFWGRELTRDLWRVSSIDRERLVAAWRQSGFNLVSFTWEAGLSQEDRNRLDTWCRALRTQGFALMAHVVPSATGAKDGPETSWDSAKALQADPPGGIAPDLWTLDASSIEGAKEAAGILRAAGVKSPLAALPLPDAEQPDEIARALDFCMGPFDWDEPLPRGGKTPGFSNRALVSYPEYFPLADAASRRDSNKPFIAIGGGGWPNLYSVEWPILASVTAAFQDWDGLCVRDPEGVWDGSVGSRTPFSALMPFSAVLFRRGDIPPAAQRGFVNGGRPEGGLDLSALAHRMTGPSETGSRNPTAQVDLRLKKVVADNKRWEWQGNIGVFKAGSPRSQALAGFLANRPLANYAWTVETPNLFSVFTLTSLTQDPTSVSKGLMVTAAARFDLDGAEFNAGRTALLKRSDEKILCEKLKGRVAINRSKSDPGMRARAFDAAGGPVGRSVPLAWKGKSVSFRWPEGAAWVILETGLSRVRQP